MNIYKQTDNYNTVIVTGKFDHIEFTCSTSNLERLDLYDSGIKNLFLKIPNTNNLKTLILPKNLISLEIEQPLEKIKNITFPKTLKEITNSGLAYSDIEKLDLSDTSLETIGELAFSSSSIKSIMLPSSLKIIGRSAFENTDLERINFPENIEEIYRFAFFNCTNLKEADFSSCKNKITIKRSLFESCKNLSKVILPRNIDQLYLSAFAGTKVKTLILPRNISEIFFSGETSVDTLIYTGKNTDIISELNRHNGRFKILSQIPLDILLDEGKSFKEINNIYKTEENIR